MLMRNILISKYQKGNFINAAPGVCSSDEAHGILRHKQECLSHGRIQNMHYAFQGADSYAVSTYKS